MNGKAVGRWPNPYGSALDQQRSYGQQELLSHSAANLYGQYANQLQNIAKPKPIPEPQPVTHRTPEEITAQLYARMAELEEEAAKPEILWPCETCRWGSGLGTSKRCGQPLITGLGGAVFTWVGVPHLCGPERALWEEKPVEPSIWQRFINWFLEPWMNGK